MPVNDHPSSPTDPNEPPNGPLRSPIRPQAPDAPSARPRDIQPDQLPVTEPLEPSTNPKDPGLALEVIRRKMENVANEFANGKINRAQFNAMYGRYDEQRMIIERLVERNPDSNAWEQVARPGHTSFLRDHFTARCLYYVIFRLSWPRPLMMGGEQQPRLQTIEPALRALINMPKRPRTGLARKALADGHWLVLALGEHAVTFVVFNLEPATAQLNRIRDLHNDFERANQKALERGTSTLEKMVFPQRALVE